MANSARPEQGAWAEKMMALMDGPVEFHDCDDVMLVMDGGSDQAGFVQVIQGKVEDPSRIKAMLADTTMLHEMRPDIIGGTLALEPDGTFTETIAFRDEDSARARARRSGAPEVRSELEVHDGRGEVLRPPPPLVRVGLRGANLPTSFDVSADAYLRFMGRWSEPLTGEFLESADVRVTGQVLDVGCGPGVLTAVLVDRYGAPAVAAIDPSESFVAATRARFPGLDVRQGVAEALPYADRTFDAALAQLVVHFMTDPVAGLRDMGRVTKPGGVVAACVWDHAGGGSPLSLFWSAAHDVDPAAPSEADLPGTKDGQLAAYARDAGLGDVTSSALTVTNRFESFDEWWAPYLLGVGPLGSYVATLGSDHVRALKERCRQAPPRGSVRTTRRRVERPRPRLSGTVSRPDAPWSRRSTGARAGARGR